MADAKATGLTAWRNPLVWGPAAAMGVIIVVLVVLAALYGVQATQDSHARTMDLVGLPLVGGASAAVNVVDSSLTTVAFEGVVFPVGSSASSTSAVTIPRTAKVENWPTQLDVKGLQPKTAYQAIIRSLDKSGAPTGHKDLTLAFTTAAAVMLGPVTGLYVKDITASEPNLAPGWSMLLVGFDPLPLPPMYKTEQVAYMVSVLGIGMFQPFSRLYDSFTGGTPITVPSGLPVTVSVQPAVSDVVYGTPFYSTSNYTVGGCVLPMGPVVVAAPVVGQTPAAGPAKFLNDPGNGVPSCTLPLQ